MVERTGNNRSILPLLIAIIAYHLPEPSQLVNMNKISSTYAYFWVFSNFFLLRDSQVFSSTRFSYDM